MSGGQGGPPCLILRVEAGARHTDARVEALGWTPVPVPSGTVTATGAPLGDGPWQAILVTSGHALRAIAGRESLKSVPVLAVGDATSALAVELGFASVRSAHGDVTALARLAMVTLSPDAGPVLYPRGETVAGDIEGVLAGAGFTITAPVVYRVEPAPDFAARLAAALAGPPGSILLHAPSAGRAVAASSVSGLTSQWRVACLSRAVASTIADLDWAEVHVAGQPDEDSLLAALGSP